MTAAGSPEIILPDQTFKPKGTFSDNYNSNVMVIIRYKFLKVNIVPFYRQVFFRLGGDYKPANPLTDIQKRIQIFVPPEMPEPVFEQVYTTMGLKTLAKGFSDQAYGRTLIWVLAHSSAWSFS